MIKFRHPQVPTMGQYSTTRSRHILTMGAISGSNCQFRALHWHHFTSCEFKWSVKTSWKSRPVDISQWRQWACIVIKYSYSLKQQNEFQFTCEHTLAFAQTTYNTNCTYTYIYMHTYVYMSLLHFHLICRLPTRECGKTCCTW